MKKRRLTFLLLILLLIAVVAVGIWLLSRDRTEVNQTSAENSPDHAALQVTQYQLAYSDLEEDVVSPNQGFDRLFLYDEKICRFTLLEEPEGDFSIQLASVTDGAVLDTYDASCFPDHIAPEQLLLYLDADGQLWGLGRDDRNQWVGPGLCKPGQTWEVWEALNRDLPEHAGYVRQFFIWKDQAVIYNGTYRTLTILDCASGSVSTRENILSCTFDGQGSLYTVTLNTPDRFIEKYALDTGETPWKQPDHKLPSWPISLACGSGGSVYLLCNSETSQIFALNPETGEAEREILSLWADTDILNEVTPYLGALSFAVDAQENVALCQIDFSLSDPDNRWIHRKTWVLSPSVRQVDANQAVTLTITAPYPVDSITGAVRMYQRQHPEVQVVWDTQYLSREEFGANIQEYKEKITLRTMTGDTGDLQMIVGAGISQDVITDTDAFADLSSYLEDCPFREELEWNLLETLRAEDGAIRAVPLGIRPSYYLYNLSLWKEQAPSLDPDNVAWSELLKLALQWKQENVDLSLTSWSPNFINQGKNSLLADILLANLYGDGQTDGGFPLDTPDFRALLADLKELWNAPQLIRGDGERVTPGFFRKSLYATVYSTTYFVDRVGLPYDLAEREGVEVCVAPKPWGEQKQPKQGYAFCWGIPSASEYKDAAWDLLEFILSSNALPGYAYSSETDTLNNAAQNGRYELFERSRGIPARSDFEQFQALRKYPYSRYDEIYGWSDAVQVPIEDYLNGKRTLDEAMETASDNWSRLLMG